MLRIPPKKMLPSQMGKAIRERIVSSVEAPLDEAKTASMEKDCQDFQELRDAVGNSGDVAQLLEYASCIYSVLLKLDIEEFSVLWSNSLGSSKTPVQGYGLRFELLNVLHNLSAAISNEAVEYASRGKLTAAAIAFRQAAGVLLQCRETELQQLLHGPPPEMADKVLHFLYQLCLVQAQDCHSETLPASDRPKAFWQLHILYKLLAREAEAFVFIDSTWIERLRERSHQLQVVSCFLVGKDLASSRKRRDQAIARAALEYCVKIGPDEAEVAFEELNLARNRREQSLLTMIPDEELMNFDPGNFFDEEVLISMEPIDFYVPHRVPQMFSSLLPLPIASAPLILHEKLIEFVNREILLRRYDLNRQVRSVIVKFNVPCEIELAQKPTKVPESLIHIRHRIQSRGGIKRVRSLRNLAAQEARQCEAIINNALETSSTKSDELDILRQSLEAGLNGLRILEAKLERSASLLALIEGDPSDMAKFLRIPATQPKSTKHRTDPALLAKTMALWNDVTARLSARTEGHITINQRAREYDFFTPVLGLVESAGSNHKDWNLEDLNVLFEQAKQSFSKDLESLPEEKEQTKKDIQSLIDLHAEFLAMHLSVDSFKSKAAQSLLLAALQFYDLLYHFHESRRYFTALRTAANSFRDRSSSTKHALAAPSCRDGESTGNQSWQPGTGVNFA